MECWVISDSIGDVFDVYKTKEAAMCYLINKLAEDEMSDSEKWIAFKDMYDYIIIADGDMSVKLSNDYIIYAEKRKAWGFKEDNLLPANFLEANPDWEKLLSNLSRSLKTDQKE